MGLFEFFKKVKQKNEKQKMANEEYFSLVRQRAEKAFQEEGIDLDALSLQEAKHLTYEIQVQRVELEIQNEELRSKLDTLEKKFTEYYDFAPFGYCTLDKNGRILDANLTIAEQFHVERKFLIDTRFDDYIVEEDQEKFFVYLKDTLKKRKRQTCNVRLKGKDSSSLWAQLDSTVVQEDGRSPLLCRMTISNITELNQARNALLRRDSELALFNRVSQAFDSAVKLEELLGIVLKEVRRLLEVDACSIWLIDPTTGELVCKHAIGPYREAVRDWRLLPGQGIAGWVAKTGTSVIVSDTQADDRHFKGVELKTGQSLRSILSVPLRVKQEVIGVLEVLDTEVNRFNATEQALQELLASIAGIAIENAQLYEQARKDENTKEILLHEVNHRVRNTLAIILSLISNVRRHSGLKKYSISHSLMTDMILRVKGVRTVYNLLSEFEWNPLPVSELCTQVILSSLEVLSSGKEVAVEVSPSSIRISPKYANSLGLMLNELVTNTIRHTFLDRDTGKITVHIARVGETIQLEFRDDGPGYPNDVLKGDQYNLGLFLIQKMVEKDLKGKLILDNDHGAVTIIRFKPQ